MPLKHGTICSKHDKIGDKANLIASQCENALKHSDTAIRGDYLREIRGIAVEIADLAHKCFDDGQRMEVGLDTKAGRIAELEEQVKQLQGQVEDLKTREEV